MDLIQTMGLSGQGMLAQSRRIKVAAENIANADSVENAQGTGPYRAQEVTFKSVLDRKTGLTGVQASVKPDMQTPMQAVYDPASDLADARGFVQHPNVDTTVENLNMKEAQRSYEANMQALTISKDMVGRTLDMMR
jgi:flagellar basal-body rod protein FlgC